jgi:hypothetical protein
VCLQLDKVIEEMSCELAIYLNASHGHKCESTLPSGHSEDFYDLKESQESREIRELEKERAKLKRTVEAQRERESVKMDALREKIDTLLAAQRALYSMIRAVSLSNGSTWIESSAALEESVRLIKGALPLSFPAAAAAAAAAIAAPSSHTAHPSVNGREGGWGGVTGLEPAPLSVIDSLKLKSPHDKCALSLFAPMIIATDRIAPSTLTSERYVGQIPDPLQPNKPSSSKEEIVHRKPVLDVVGVKISSFKNSISAIKMFMSARVIVTTN